jgi:hypothetical protein
MDAQTLAKTLPVQKIDFLPFSSLSQLLQLSDPPLMRDGFPQLKYIERYVRKADPKCLSVVIERYYIDRDFIADFSAFYSTSLYAYPNWCQRIHFFSIDKNKVRRRLRDLARLGANDDEGGVAYQRACDAFSKEAYMGFSVIKPPARISCRTYCSSALQRGCQSRINTKIQLHPSLQNKPPWRRANSMWISFPTAGCWGECLCHHGRMVFA